MKLNNYSNPNIVDNNIYKYYNRIEVPDNKFIMRNNTWRAGSKKQDLCALGGILMAWQMGLNQYNKQMRKKEKRIEIIQEFTKNETYDYRIRAIVGETLANPKKPVPLTSIMRWY